MRALWSGSVSFGLINIPVKPYSAAKERSLSFHTADMEPVNGFSQLPARLQDHI